ncbi:type II toxin-antitoxin system RelE/ParE family toxin [Mannheimia sp. E30BD]|uniref:type II toxin-antitoxin system RelE/ParE family toxin n=1 Tax=Mannheimia sp. E30BD TaxID=3278708 RepID=UPI00359DD414
MPKELLEIQFTEKAIKNLQLIARSVSEFTGYASSGIRILEELENSINHLAMFPEMGVRGKVANTRELYHNRHRIVYEIKSNIVIIKTVIHCSKLYP